MTEFRPTRFEILPLIVKNLLIINGLMFLAQMTFSGPTASFSFEDNLALHAWQSELFRPWQLITHMFLHGDFGHIFGNMFALWMFGSILENLWGPKRFLTFYLVCGLGAAFIHLLFLNYEFAELARDYQYVFNKQDAGNQALVNAMIDFINKYHVGFPAQSLEFIRENPHDNQSVDLLFQSITKAYKSAVNNATIGASGAVFGVLAAFIYLFPNTYIYLYFLVPIKAKWLGLLYFGYEVLFALRNSAGDNVARWAHIGGAIVGFLIVLTWNKKNKKTFY